MTTEIDTREEAVQRIKSIPGDRIVLAETAREIAAPFGVDYDDEDFARLENIAPMYWGDGDEPAKGLRYVVHDIAREIGVEPVDGKSVGHGRSAREAVEGTLENIEDHVLGLETEQ